MASGGGSDSMLRFWLEREGDGTKHCRKMKRMQRGHLDSMGRSVILRGSVGRMRDNTGEEKERR
jgi:hypothetical protein